MDSEEKQEKQDRRVESGRSHSPYHQKCYPPYCDGAGPQDKQAISKLTREELEDRYLVYSDENLALKKKVKDHEKQLQRLQTALTRQDNKDKKEGAKMTASNYYDTYKVDNLEADNKHLLAKVKVLKQQLMNHSYIHSKDMKLADHKDRQRENAYPESRVPSARESKSPNANSVKNLKDKIALLEDMLENQKQKYEDKIKKLEKDLANKSTHSSLQEKISQTSRKVNDNVEIIRLRRLTDKQADDIRGLEGEAEAAANEIAKLKEALTKANARADELEKQLEDERGRSRSAIAQVASNTSNGEIIRILEEQIRDLKKEKEELKDANDKLLQISSLPQSKSDSNFKEKISALEDELKNKNKELEDKDKQLRELQDLLEVKEKALKVVPSKKTVDLHEQEKLKEVEDLKNQLEDVKKNYEEEKKRLEEMLADAKEQNYTLKERRLSTTSALDNLKEENEKLQKKFDDALNEIDEMKNALAGHENLKADHIVLQERMNALNSAKEECQCDDLCKENCQLKEDLEKLQNKFDDALKEIDAMKILIAEHDNDPNLKEELEKLKKKLADNEDELAELRNIAAEHEQCGQLKPVTPVPSKHTLHQAPSLVDPNLKEELEKLKKKLADNEDELAELRNIAAEHEQCGQLKPVTPVLSKHTLHQAPSLVDPNLKEELEKLKKKLADNEDELAELRNIAAEHEQCGQFEPATPVPSKHTLHQDPSLVDPNLKEELEKLKKKLADNEDELAELRNIAAEHEQCGQFEPVTPVPSKHTLHQDPSLVNLKQENEKLQIALTYAVRELSWDELRGTLKNAVQEFTWLETISAENLQVSKHTIAPSPSYKISQRSVKPESSGYEITPRIEVTPPSDYDITPRSNYDITPRSSYEITPPRSQRPKRKWPDPKRVISFERRRLAAMAPQEKAPNFVVNTVFKHSESSSSNLGRRVPPLTPSLVQVQRLLMARRVSSKQEKPSQPSFLTAQKSNLTQKSNLSQKSNLTQKSHLTQPSQHTQLSQPSIYSGENSLATLIDTPRKPVVLIVSQHEFKDAVKREGESTTPVLPPTEGCILDIGIHAIEMDVNLRESLMNEFRSLYLAWKFLGITEKTNPSPVAIAEYKMKVSYCGPRSPQLCEQIQKKPISINLTGKSKDGGEKHLGKGTLDLSPSLTQPGRKFLRCVPVETTEGVGLIYCSFKMHGKCCGGPYCPNGSDCPGCDHEDCVRRVVQHKDTLEICIGRLILDHPDESAHPPHIYVEYNILGYCGETLETESEPRSEVLEYNHRKRFKITNNNVKALKEMLRSDNPVPLTFQIMTEPCDLTSDTEVEEMGYASIDLNKEMLRKDEDIISAQVPVIDKMGQPQGKLSVTVLGIDTVRRHGRS